MSDIIDNADAFTKPSFTLMNRVRRALWGFTYSLFFYCSPRSAFKWRAFLLRLFGAKLGLGCHIYPKSVIWAPWNLICEDVVAISDDAIIYNPSIITLSSHCTISQEAYLCGATHDYNNPFFPLISAPIHIGAYSWICARATVLMGITVSEGAVLGISSLATHNLDPWTVYAGIPAKKIKERINFHEPQS